MSTYRTVFSIATAITVTLTLCSTATATPDWDCLKRCNVELEGCQYRCGSKTPGQGIMVCKQECENQSNVCKERCPK